MSSPKRPMECSIRTLWRTLRPCSHVSAWRAESPSALPLPHSIPLSLKAHSEPPHLHNLTLTSPILHKFFWNTNSSEMQNLHLCYLIQCIDFFFLREGEKYQCVVASHMPPTGALAHNPGMCPDWELNHDPLVLSLALNPQSYTSRG